MRSADALVVLPNLMVGWCIVQEVKKGEAEEPFADGTEPAIPLERQISHKYQTLITPSEQVEELRGGMAASEAVEGYLGD